MDRLPGGTSVRLSFPPEARIHLPIHWTSGVVLDRSMPVGDRYPRVAPGAALPQLVYPFVLVEHADGPDRWLEIAARSTDDLVGTDHGGGSSPFFVERRRPTAEVVRIASGFELTFTSLSGATPNVRPIASASDAIATHHAWLREAYGLRPRAERIAAGDLPPWLANVPVMFTFDLWRPSGEVAHNYRHLRDFVRAIAGLGVPPGALFYVPGWCAPYDGGYPHYEPAPELGGRDAFREAVDAAHDAGYRVMIHTLAWGTDPYRREFERLRPLALRNFAGSTNGSPPPPIVHAHEMRLVPTGDAPASNAADPLRGPYGGWPGGGPRQALDYASGRQPSGPWRRTARGWAFETVAIPQRCEAVLTLGGLRAAADGLLRVTVNGRSLTTPPGWFRDHDAYTFPFTFLFFEGPNCVEMECFGWPNNAAGPGAVSVPPPDDVWYDLSQAYDHPVTWTMPAVGVDTDAPAWHEAFLERLAPTVESFAIDAVHVDAAILWRWDERGFFAALKRGLPPATVFGTEVASVPGMAFFSFSQVRPAPPDPSSWQPRRTDLSWWITGEYQHFYPHLCAPRGFVPVGSVCNVNPVAPSLAPADVDATRAFLATSVDQHILPTLRVNYRDYGLDPQTRHFLVDQIVRRQSS